MRVLIVGVGAIGTHVGYALRNLPGLVLVDRDTVESRNTKNQLHPTQVVGRNKAEALRITLRSQFGVSVEAIPADLAPANTPHVLRGAELVVDCLDNAKSRRLVRDEAGKLGIPVLHVGISADTSAGIVSWTLPEEDETASGLPVPPTCQDPTLLPTYVMLGGLAAFCVDRWVRHKIKKEYRLLADTIWSPPNQ